MDQYGASLFRYALSRLRDHQLAEDAIQETFVAALSARYRFTGSSSEKRWLVAILNHKIIDLMRDRQRHAVLNSSEQWPEHLSETQERRSNDLNDPESYAERSDFRRVFAECASKLSPQVYKAFMLCEVHEMSGREAAEILGVSSTNMWVMLHRARERLGICIKARLFGRPC